MQEAPAEVSQEPCSLHFFLSRFPPQAQGSPLFQERNSPLKPPEGVFSPLENLYGDHLLAEVT